MLLFLMGLRSVGRQACVVEKKLTFFFWLGVFEPVEPEWAGQTWASELVPAGCECSWARAGSGKRRLTKVQMKTSLQGSYWGPVWEAAFCRAGLRICPRGGGHLPSCPAAASSPTGLNGECVHGAMCGHLDLHSSGLGTPSHPHHSPYSGGQQQM